MKHVRSSVGITAAMVAMLLTFGATQAVAATSVSDVPVAKSASAFTKDFAKSNQPAISRAGHACGGNYQLASADPLPFGVDPKLRKGVLYNYITPDSGSACAIFDNNTGVRQYMELTSCPGTNVGGPGCSSDKGNFLEYAGPTYTSTKGPRGTCWVHQAYMQRVISEGITYGKTC
ncbi:hypothetical protein [Streptomyces sp. NRRL S-241]|uniref:hypothetical protein n=1 Tax=Streptomyces sp. NRRL S-241 TaxID=1463896 RepID=UPI00131A87E4|nr:hypothetical protein [Streptomyces sp. NRRL S-241]